MHKISNQSFTYEDDEGNKQTVKGHLAIEPPQDGDYTAGRNIGSVVFVVEPSNEGQSDKTDNSEDTVNEPESRRVPTTKK